MPYDPLGFFKAGQEIGKSKYAGATAATNVVMDAFKSKSDRHGKLQDAITLESVKNSMPASAKDQAQTRMYDAKTEELSRNGGSRSVFLVNRRTGKISKAGDSSMAEVDPNLVGQKDRIMGVDIPAASAMNMFTAAEASTKQIDDLIGLLNQTKVGGPEAPNKLLGGITGKLRPIQGMGNKATQDYGAIMVDFSDRLLRLRSGAQINEAEYSRLMGMLPKWWRNTDSDIEQLTKFRNEYTNLMGRLSGGGLSTGGAERADAAQDESDTSNPAFEEQAQYQPDEDPAGLFD